VRGKISGREDIAKTISSAAGTGDAYIHHLGSGEINVESANSASGIFNVEDKIFRAEGSGRAVPGEPAFSEWTARPLPRRVLKTDGAWHIAKLTRTHLRLDFTHRAQSAISDKTTKDSAPFGIDQPGTSSTTCVPGCGHPVCCTCSTQ
jgi:hypothetical protein